MKKRKNIQNVKKHNNDSGDKKIQNKKHSSRKIETTAKKINDMKRKYMYKLHMLFTIDYIV